MTMDPELQSMCDEYRQVLAGMDMAEAQEHPGRNPQVWNVQQVVEHLVLTYRSTGRSIQDRLEFHDNFNLGPIGSRMSKVGQCLGL